MGKTFTPGSIRIILFSAALLWVLCFCGRREMYDFSKYPAFSRGYTNAVIEIPAGTNRIINWDAESRMFVAEQEDNEDKLVDFLPFPANYGFVPGTFTDPVLGGEGQPVAVMIICESVPTGTVMEVVPLLVLYFDDDNVTRSNLTDPVVIAVPARESQRVIQAGSYEDLFDDYPDLMDILVKWFVSYRGSGSKRLRAMGDGDVAMKEIKKWEVRRL